METISPTAADDSSGANPSSVKSEDSSPRHESGRGSPPPNCAICLGTCRNKSFTDSCLHQFCFKCLLTWSKVKAECPLCKQVFKSIIHNVRSNHQYDEYTVEQRHEETTQSIDIDNMAAHFTRRFRYRTTLTLPRRESLAIQQLLLHYPLVADVLPPPAHAPPPPAPRRRSPNSFRRTVYRHNLWARPLPDFTGRFRDCSPHFYRTNESQMHRLVPWLNRELHYLLNENAGHISYVMTRILELLPIHHISSPEFREVMHRYFGDRTEHFLHELYCFASTPYDMAGYDRHVQYTTDSRISTMVNEVISSSDSEASVDSDIVMVSHSEPAEPPPGPSRFPPPVYPHHYIPQPPVNNVISIETFSSDTDDDSSDEVMVVGYIKPPQDRTPEVVDLLGSDSDVIVQDAAPPSPAPAPASASASASAADEAPPPPPPRLPVVKLSLKRHRARSPAARRDDSSDGSYVPPPPRRRRRRARASSSAAASDTTATSFTTATTAGSDTDDERDALTPPPPPTAAAAGPALPDDDLAESESESSDSRGRRRRATKKKAKRKTRRSDSSSDGRRARRRGSRSRRRRSASRSRRAKRKSESGRGVKRSRRAEPAPAVAVPAVAAAGGGEEARPSRSRRRRRRASRDSGRLRSVVSVVHKGGEPSPSGEAHSHTPPRPEPERRAADDSDSDENLPLNLSLQKTLFPSL